MMSSSLTTARLHWQVGNWHELAAMDAGWPSDDYPDPGNTEIALYKAQALFQVGSIDQAQRLIVALTRSGVEHRVIIAGLLGGAHCNVARAWMILGDQYRAEAALRRSLALNQDGGDQEVVLHLRSEREGVDIGRRIQAVRSGVLGARKLFIDCGGYDGCSVLKFLLSFPEYDAVTFEPNPDLWPYYDGLPTTLMRKAAYTYDGTVSFTVDPIDGDGSSLIAGKTIDFQDRVSDSDCPVIESQCIDLSAYVGHTARSYGRIVLKMDIEGAEYEVLEKMLEDGTLMYVDQLFCEFHHEKIDIGFERHRNVVARVREVTQLDAWDANYSLFKLAPDNDEKQKKARDRLVSSILKTREKMKSVEW